MEQLLTLIRSLGLVSEDLETFLRQNIKSVQLPRKHLLLSAGKIANKMYFVESGLLRGFYLKDGKDITTWVMPENELSTLRLYWGFRPKH